MELDDMDNTLDLWDINTVLVITISCSVVLMLLTTVSSNLFKYKKIMIIVPLVYFFILGIAILYSINANNIYVFIYAGLIFAITAFLHITVYCLKFILKK